MHMFPHSDSQLFSPHSDGDDIIITQHPCSTCHLSFANKPNVLWKTALLA